MWRNYVLPAGEVSLHALNSGLSVSQLIDFDRITIFDVLVGQRNINVLSQETLHQD